MAMVALFPFSSSNTNGAENAEKNFLDLDSHRDPGSDCAFILEVLYVKFFNPLSPH